MVEGIACGVITSMFINHMCKIKAIGPIISKIMTGYGLVTQWQSIMDAAENKQWDLVAMHYDFDSKFIERICREYDLPVLENHITDLDTLFHLKYNRGYTSRFAENQLGITTDETDNWRNLDIAGKVYIALQEE